ncbi:MAG: tetratricopeptide repeat protein, partial [Lysobacteraceae bacterium]
MSRSTLKQAQQLHADGKLDEAEACYRQILHSAPGDPIALHYLAVVLLQRDRKQEAMHILTGLVAMPHPHPDTPALFALACRDMGMYEEGIAACEKALRANPGDALTALLIGNLYVLNGNYQVAEQFLRRATSRTPRSAEAWAYLGMALHRQGRWQEAIDAYQRSCDLKPDDHKMYFNIALCAESAGDPDAACAALNHAQRLAPHRVDVVSRLANIH